MFLRFFTGFLIQLIPFAFLCCYPFYNYFRFSRKKIIFFTCLLIAGLGLFFSITSNLLLSRLSNPNSQPGYGIVNSIFLCSLLPCLLWYLYAIKAIWQKKLFVFSFTLTSALTITSISNIIITWVTADNELDFLPYSYCTVPVLLITTSIILPLLYLLLKYFYIPMEDGLSAKECGYLSIFSLLIFIMLTSGLSFLSYNYLYANPMALFLYVSLFVTIFVIYTVIFRMYFLAHEKYIAQQNYLQMQYQIELRDEQSRRIQENIENNRRIRHDLKHHLLTLQGFLNNGESDNAAQYLQSYMNSINTYEVQKFCDNAIVNILLSHYSSLAKENDIDFRVRINIPKELWIQDSDISVLLGNLLENAITASNHTKGNQHFIYLNMICSGKMLVITVDNSFDGTVNSIGAQYLSTKPNHRGYGLKSLADIAEKYNGGADFSHEDMVFHSSIMLGQIDD